MLIVLRIRIIEVVHSRFFRFLVSGAINTAVTFGIYLLFLPVFSYPISYSIAYVIGIGVAYFLNRAFVFRAHQGARSALLLPLVYVAQYGIGILMLWLLIDQLKLSEEIAPLVVIVVTIPLTYLLTRFVFVGK